MGLTPRKDGLYIQFPVVDDGKVLQWGRGNPTAKLKRWKAHTTNKTLAKQQEAKIKTDLIMGKIPSEVSKPLSFAQWGEAYLGLEGVKNLRSYKERVHALRLQLIPFLGKKLLNEIQAKDVEAFRVQRRLRKGGIPSLGTINNDHIILKHVLSLAERRGLIESNPAKKVPLPNPNNERDRVLSEEEWNRLHQTASSHLKPILLIAYQLGLRLGEIVGLTWDRVDLQRGIIKLRIADTKTKEARLLPMTPSVKNALIELSRVRNITSNHVFLYKGKPVKRVKRTVCDG